MFGLKKFLYNVRPRLINYPKKEIYINLVVFRYVKHCDVSTIESKLIFNNVNNFRQEYILFSKIYFEVKLFDKNKDTVNQKNLNLIKKISNNLKGFREKAINYLISKKNSINKFLNFLGKLIIGKIIFLILFDQ